MLKTYVIWWHSKFIEEIDRSATTIAEIVDKISKTVKLLEKLRRLERLGKIKVKLTGSLNPIYIEIMDPSVEAQVAKNPLVETLYK
jgi:hypothetical protein